MHLQLASAPRLCRADGTVLPLALRDAALLTWLVLVMRSAPACLRS